MLLAVLELNKRVKKEKYTSFCFITSLPLFNIYKHYPFSICPITHCLIFFSFLSASFPIFTNIIPLPDPVILFCPSFHCSPHSFISGLLALMSNAMAQSIQDGVLNVPAMHHSHLTLL